MSAAAQVQPDVTYMSYVCSVMADVHKEMTDARKDRTDMRQGWTEIRNDHSAFQENIIPFERGLDELVTRKLEELRDSIASRLRDYAVRLDKLEDPDEISKIVNEAMTKAVAELKMQQGAGIGQAMNIRQGMIPTQPSTPPRPDAEAERLVVNRKRARSPAMSP